MVTQRVDGGGDNLIKCAVCGQYYDPGKHFGCPHCSGNSVGLTQGLYSTRPVGASASDNYGSGSPYSPTEAVGHVSGGHDYYRGTETQVAAQIEKRSPDSAGIRPERAHSPVVGWLVALNGPTKGTDYRLHAGYNYIGRERGDICLRGDMAVSKERDSCINYDPSNRTFYLSHENGINQTLLNECTVRKEGAQLFDYDVVTIGQTKLLFMPLCGKRFNW